MFKAVEINYKEALRNASMCILQSKDIIGKSIRVTETRLVILEAIMSIKGSFTANDILKLLDYTQSTKSVYNAIRLFEEREIIVRVPAISNEINYKLIYE